MGSRAFLFVGLLLAIFLVASEVSARELAETEQTDKTNGLEESKYPGGGCGRYGCGGGGGCRGYGCGGGGGGGCRGYGCGGGGGGGGYPRGGRCGGYGCCGGGGYRCRCCASAAEAEAYAAAQAKAKTQN